MKHFISLLIVSSLAINVFSQAPTPQSADPNSKLRMLGSSIKKYIPKNQKKAKPGEKTIEPADEETIRIETDVVVQDVLVTDPKSTIVAGLKKEDFVVVEDGVVQSIETFGEAGGSRRPRSIVLILDFEARLLPYKALSLAAARDLVERLSKDDELAIVTAGDLLVRSEFTSDKSALRRTLDAMAREDMPLTGTWDIGVLFAVLGEMFEDTTRQRVVVFQGDASEAVWVKDDKEKPLKTPIVALERRNKFIDRSGSPTYGFSDLRRSIESAGATIYCVVPGARFLGRPFKERVKLAKAEIIAMSPFVGANEIQAINAANEFQGPDAELIPVMQAATSAIAEWSGGFFGFMERPPDASVIYDEVFKLMNNRYSIVYSSTNKKKDGTRREVKITVRDHPEYTVTTRRAYVR